MKRVAIITARGDSKRLPRKNIRPFHGRPIIHYAIAAAKASMLFDDVIVSTDDEEITAVAHQGGCQWVIKRPAELANDHATTGQVMAHAVDQFLIGGAALEHACCIYPCTPLMTSADLQKGFDLLLHGTRASYVYPVAQYAPAVQRMMRRDENGLMSMVWPKFDQVRTQDLEPRWHDAGQWYWGLARAWRDEIPILVQGVGMPIEGWRAIDIDTYDDWVIAEAVYQAKFSNEGRRAA